VKLGVGLTFVKVIADPGAGVYEENAVDGGPSLARQLRKLISEASERKGGSISRRLSLCSTIDSAQQRRAPP
jgi:hypothetical protein